MIYERLTLIIILSAFSSLASQTSSAIGLNGQNFGLASELNLANDEWNKLENRIAPGYSQPNLTAINNFTGSSNKSLTGWQLAQNKLESEQQSDTANNSLNIESASKIHREWFLAAMGLTSAISLFLLLILFRKPAPKLATAAIPPASQKNIDDRDYLIPDKSLAADSVREISVDRIPGSSLQQVDLDVVGELIQDLQQGERFPQAETGRRSHLRQGQNNLRRKAIWELAEIGDYRSIKPLTEARSGADSVDKSLISEAIAKITDRSFQPINDELFALLQDENPQVRKNAIQDLAALYNFVSPITKRLTKMQSDTDYEVRETATRALHQLNLSSFSSTLNRHLANETNALAPEYKGKANLHLVAYLLEELDNDR